MKRLAFAGLLALTLAFTGCGGGESVGKSSTSGASGSPATSETTSASGCTAGGLDAMTALADFQLELDDAQKAGKITSDQLLEARDKLFKETQAAQANEDWAAYCKAIDDMRAELRL
jgi:hypothetical protein